MQTDTNPYKPTALSPETPSTRTVQSRSPPVLLLFVLGAILGLQLGSFFEVGVEETIKRFIAAPYTALKFYAMVGVFCLATSFLYRVPRWMVFGLHEIRWHATLVSGVLMSSLGFVAVISLERIGMLNTAWASTASGWLIVCSIVFVSAIIAVEIEALIGRSRNVTEIGR